MPTTATCVKPVSSPGLQIPDSKIAVKMPPLFVSFAQTQPQVNPHYETIRAESEAWLVEFCSLAPAMQVKLQKLDFSYFCAIMAPNASPEEYRTLCDWGNWVFPYDDMFDGGDLGGELQDEPVTSRQVVGSLLEPFREGSKVSENRLRIVEAHDDVCNRVFSTCTPGKCDHLASDPNLTLSIGVKRRFLNRMELYSQGVLSHLDYHFGNQIPTPEEMIEVRRASAGSGPLYHLIEYAHKLEVPDKVFGHSSIKQLENLGMEMVCITNDLVSYPKEEGDGCTSNVISACRMKGMGAQEAFDHVGALLAERYERWEAAESKIPKWGEDVDTHVQKYIEGIKCTVRANLYWSFRTKRYLGRDPEEVRRTGVIYVLEYPLYLSKPQIRVRGETEPSPDSKIAGEKQGPLCKSLRWIRNLGTRLRVF